VAIKRVTFRLYPTKQVEELLYYHRKLHKELYNAAVYNRKTQYQRFGHSVDYFEQQNCLPEFKEVWPEYKQVNSQALQATIKRVDFAFKRFFAGLSKYPRFKSIYHYSGWTYPALSGWKVHTTGDHGYLELSNIGQIRMRGQARIWGRTTTCTIVYRLGKWYASITVDVDDELLKQNRSTGTGAVGIDIGCKTALAITDGENHQLVSAPQFLRKAENKIKRASKDKRRRRPPNHKKKVKASKRWKKAQKRVSKLQRQVANQRANWVHQVSTEIISSNSYVATEELEVAKMTRKAFKKNKRQKAGLNKSVLDVGFGMLRAAIKYKVEEAGGLFVEVPTKTVKPSQTCPQCGTQQKKTLDERVHKCDCGCVLDRDIAAALVSLLWSQDKLLGDGNAPVKRGCSSSTSKTKERKNCGSMKQLGQMKRQKRRSTVGDAETPTSHM
jgi:putative transposase